MRQDNCRPRATHERAGYARISAQAHAIRKCRATRGSIEGTKKTADKNAKHTPFLHKSFTTRGGQTRQYGEIVARAELIAQTPRLFSSPAIPIIVTFCCRRMTC